MIHTHAKEWRRKPDGEKRTISGFDVRKKNSFQQLFSILSCEESLENVFMEFFFCTSSEARWNASLTAELLSHTAQGGQSGNSPSESDLLRLSGLFWLRRIDHTRTLMFCVIPTVDILSWAGKCWFTDFLRLKSAARMAHTQLIARHFISQRKKWWFKLLKRNIWAHRNLTRQTIACVKTTLSYLYSFNFKIFLMLHFYTNLMFFIDY